jgi:hypothetical protein
MSSARRVDHDQARGQQRPLSGEVAVTTAKPLLTGCGCRNHQNQRHIADTQPADVNVGYGAIITDSLMSGVSLLELVTLFRR